MLKEKDCQRVSVIWPNKKRGSALKKIFSSALATACDWPIVVSRLVHIYRPGIYQYDQSPLPCRLWGCDLSDINRPLKPLRRRLLTMQLQSNPLKEPSLIFPDPRVAGVRLHKLPRSEYITDQLNSNIDQQIAHVCPDDILEVAYKTGWGPTQGPILWKTYSILLFYFLNIPKMDFCGDLGNFVLFFHLLGKYASSCSLRFLN